MIYFAYGCCVSGIQGCTAEMVFLCSMKSGALAEDLQADCWNHGKAVHPHEWWRMLAVSWTLLPLHLPVSRWYLLVG